MRAPIQVSIEPSEQELQSPPAPTAMVEVDDICAFDPLPLPLPQAPAANSTDPAPAATDDVIEIELTAAQIDAMLTTG
jgi:hypothetical protein